MANRKKFRVVELFAGVGGFRLGLEGWEGKSASSNYTKPLNSSYQVVWSNQWEPSSSRPGEQQEANMVYHKRWPNNENSKHYPHDIATVCAPEMTDEQVDDNIPNHDLLVGGFPCQDYSVAGVNSKGIEGKKGVLWWNIHKMLQAKRPKYLLLENVDRLLKSPTSQRGRDFAIMLSTLWQLGYQIEWRVINAADYGMPQRRRRVFILGYHKSSDIKIDKLEPWVAERGVFAKAFPAKMTGIERHFKLSKDPESITNDYNYGKFLNSGVMLNGNVWMSDYKVADDEFDINEYSAKYHLLKDVLDHNANGETKNFVVDENKKLKAPLIKVQREGTYLNEHLVRDGDAVILETEMDKWRYLKGKKAELRRTSKNHEFYYTEGPLALTDALDKPSRTIITSEGGAGASRFKHLIKLGNKYRRLLPKELERLNMFPDNHTQFGQDPYKIGESEITAGKRAFFMGNALVVGVIEKIGVGIIKTIENANGQKAKQSSTD
jgi:DNA (cytosine-5)-methyltransferase 1